MKNNKSLETVDEILTLASKHGVLNRLIKQLPSIVGAIDWKGFGEGLAKGMRNG